MIKNGYATLGQYKAYGVANATPDYPDDTVIEGLIDAASRYIDSAAGRRFFPRVETRYFSVVPSPKLWLDDDLLEVITLTNGNGDAIAAASYNLLPRNEYPKYAVQLLPSSNVYWQQDSSSDGEYVIPLAGFWGYHEYYSTAWKAITTVVEVGDLNAVDTTFTVADASALDKTGSQLIKIDNELMTIAYTVLADVTVDKRGDNGSTGAIHTNGSTVYLYQYPADITEACLEIVNGIYKRRTGENVTASSILTAGGVLVTPRDVPDLVVSILRRYARIV